MKELAPKVLICAPTSERHKHLIDDWLKHLDSLDYNNIDVCLVDTTPNKTDYFSYLKNKKVKGKEIILWRYDWDPKKEYALQMLANVREQMRQFFIEHKEYYSLFWLDDDIFIPKWGIQRLLSYNKDLVGFYVHVYYKPIRKPCVFKSGEIVLGKGLEYFTFAEIKEYKEFAKKFEENKLTKAEQNLIPFLIKDRWHPYLFQPYAVNLGCCMCSRKVTEEIPFRTHSTFLMGEDLWWFNECNDKKFQFWCDSKTRCKHLNTTWSDINKIDLRFRDKQGIYIAHGEDGKEVEGAVFLAHSKHEEKKLKEKLNANQNKL